MGERLDLTAAIASLEQCWAILDRTPEGPVEPCELEVVPHESPGSPGIAHAIFAPTALSASQVTVRCIPRGIRAGDSCCICLDVHDADPRGVAQYIAIVAHLRMTVRIVHSDGSLKQPSPLVATYQGRLSGKGYEVIASLSLPHAAACGDNVIIESIELAGHPISAHLPARVPVVDCVGLSAPLRISPPGAHALYDDFSFCLSESGTFYIARGAGRSSSTLHLLSPDGIELREPIVVPIRCDSIAVDSTNDALYVGLKDDSAWGGPVVAIDGASGSIRWRSATRVMTCWSIAVMSRAGLVIAASSHCGKLHVLRASDGESLASVKANQPLFVAVDEASSFVFSATTSLAVQVFQWTGATLEIVQTIRQTDRTVVGCFHMSTHVLAVVPPVRGKSTAHLVVGSFNGHHVTVFSLPSLSFVFETDVPCTIYGATADATGTSLVLKVSVKGELEAIAWPLPGMPPLH